MRSVFLSWLMVATACSGSEGTFSGSPRSDGGSNDDGSANAAGGASGRSTGGASGAGAGTGGRGADAQSTNGGAGGRTGSAGSGGSITRDASTDGTTGTGGAIGTGGGDAGGTCDAGADAAATECIRDGDCCAGLTCSGLVFTNPVKVHCQAPFAGGAAIGSTCTGTLYPNPACGTGICASSLGSCTKRCSADADCGDPGFLCRGVTVNSTPMGFCARECTGDPSCLSGQICVLRGSTTLDRFEKYCRPKPTASAPGTTSTDPSTCDHGQTVIIGTAQYCTAPCDTDADCPSAVSKCQQFTQLTPITNTSVQTGLCVKP